MKKHIYKPKYSNDFMRWHGIFKNLHESPDKRQEQIIALQNKIITDNDAALAYYFATDIGQQNYKMQNVIIKTKSAKYGILFAMNIPNADIAALQKMMFESEGEDKMEYICNFGCFVPGANIKKIEALVLAEGEAKWAHMMLKHVKGTSPAKFKKIIMESKCPRYLYELAKHLKKKKDLEAIEELIIASKSKTYIRMFAEKIPSANVEKLEQAILDMDDVEQVKKFATYVKRSKMRNFVVMF